jgi:DNA-binding transcriptional LysR family regulator
MDDWSWDDLKVFEAAWRTGSLTAAAASLGLAQATASRRIASLEERAGHRLFDRRRGGLVPTAAAEALWPHVEAMADAARRARAALQGLETRPEGIVRVATMPGLAVDVLPALVPLLTRRYPELRLDVLSDNQQRDLDRREADVALRTQPPSRGDLVYRRVANIPLLVVASPAYVATLSPQATVRDLDWVQYDAELAHFELTRLIDQLLEGRPAAMWSNSFLALRAAVQHGVGCTVTTALQARHSGLVPVDVPGLPSLPDAPLYLVVHAALQHVPRVRAVVDFLDEALREAVSGRWPPEPG